jgi:hypothetical protein
MRQFLADMGFVFAAMYTKIVIMMNIKIVGRINYLAIILWDMKEINMA